MVYLVIFLFSLYYVLLLALLAGWHVALQQEEPIISSDNPHKQVLSVIIPVRNEELNIKRLVHELQCQTLKSFEVILVNDHSSDQSRNIIVQLTHDLAQFRILDNPGVGKKAALTAGIHFAKGEIIVTTDADCFFSSSWLELIHEHFCNPTVKLTFGAVRINSGASFFAQLQSMEFASVLGTGVAAHALGFPLYCNGANLAFRRSTFEEVKGYEGNMDIPSGDDEFLLKKVAAVYPSGTKFMNQSESIVSTIPQPTLKEFVHQRVRWAGKWKYSQTASSKILAFAFAVVQVLVLLVIWMILFTPYPTAFLFAFFGKIFLEFLFVFLVQHFLKERTKLLPFLILQLVYPFYFLGVGILSNFTAYSWKGRTWRNKGKF
jgi:poly-beta-1,6-N-acetyl-D-glucosamine synthase